MKTLRFWVLPNNGFQTVAMRTGYYSRPKEDALVMLKPLQGDLSDWVAELHPGVKGMDD